jgi:hypothetical protein
MSRLRSCRFRHPLARVRASPIPGAPPISVGIPLAMFADGSRAKRVVVDVPIQIEVVAARGAIPFDETEKVQVLRWLRLAEHDDDVVDALRFFHRGTWFDIYFAYEVMKSACGGQQKLLRRPWAKQHELELVRRNANLYRHVRLTSGPPPHGHSRCRKPSDFWEQPFRHGSLKSCSIEPHLTHGSFPRALGRAPISIQLRAGPRQSDRTGRVRVLRANRHRRDNEIAALVQSSKQLR